MWHHHFFTAADSVTPNILTYIYVLSWTMCRLYHAPLLQIWAERDHDLPSHHTAAQMTTQPHTPQVQTLQQCTFWALRVHHVWVISSTPPASTPTVRNSRLAVPFWIVWSGWGTFAGISEPVCLWCFGSIKVRNKLSGSPTHAVDAEKEKGRIGSKKIVQKKNQNVLWCTNKISRK